MIVRCIRSSATILPKEEGTIPPVSLEVAGEADVPGIVGRDTLFRTSFFVGFEVSTAAGHGTLLCGELYDDEE